MLEVLEFVAEDARMSVKLARHVNLAIAKARGEEQKTGIMKCLTQRIENGYASIRCDLGTTSTKASFEQEIAPCMPRSCTGLFLFGSLSI